MRYLTPIVPFLLVACKSATPTPTETGPTDVPTVDQGLCGNLQRDQGQPVCSTNIRNANVFADLEDDGVVYLVPVTGSLPAVAIDGANYDIVSFLRLADPALAGLEEADLDEVIYGTERMYSTGVLRRTDAAVTFTVDEGAGWEATYDEVEHAHDELEGLVHPDTRYDAELPFVALGRQQDVVGGWRARFPLDGIDQDPDYVAYASYEAVGTVRILDRATYELGRGQAQWGPGDILVLVDAESDTDRIVAGVVSDEPIPYLSPLVQRSRNRGTPACYLRDATSILAIHADEIVRLSCDATEVTVTSATAAEADAFQAGLQGDAVGVVPPDLLTVDLVGVLDMDLTDTEAAIATYGLDAVRLARAYQEIPGANQLRAMAVPAAFYTDFLERNTWITDLGDGPALYTYQETLDSWLVDPTFLSDAAERRVRLESLAAAMRGGFVDPLLFDRLEEQLPLLFGSPLTLLRFRPSLNIQEQAVLPYADLYDAGTGCVADDLDADFLGPSACEATRPEERLAALAVAEVYASLWSFDAYELRAFHGVDQTQLAMSLLVTDRIDGELADAVTVRPNPLGQGTLVATQPDDQDAVGRANEYPTMIELTDRPIWRQPSSEASRGDLVLTHDEAQALGTLAATLDAAYPNSDAVVGEWKLLANGVWALKGAQPVTP